MMFARMGTVICNKSYIENISLQKQEMENPYLKKIYIYIYIFYRIKISDKTHQFLFFLKKAFYPNGQICMLFEV